MVEPVISGAGKLKLGLIKFAVQALAEIRR
jgi:hypothetical protein